MQLTNNPLLRTQAYINGAWSDADDGETYAIYNPANGEQLASVPNMGAAETRRAIATADVAFRTWRDVTAMERSVALQRWGELMLANVDALAEILTAEQGKPLAEAKGEIGYAASFLTWFAGEALRVYGDTIPQFANDKRLVVIKQPIGVCAGITPWNFPSAMITRKVAPAIAVGCSMVVKPAPATPLSALALCELAEQAGIPAGVFSVVTGDVDAAKEIGGEMTSNPTVRKLGFTGSTRVGKLLLEQTAQNVKKVSLELGGNAPFIVFADADLDEAVTGAIVCKFRNTGQTCVSANRMLIHDDIYEEFTDKLIETVREMKVADGFAEGAQLGPLINQAALEKVERHVADAVSNGATVALGGGRHALGGTFYQPTILTDVEVGMMMTSEETFGPVAGLIRFRDEDEAIRIANDTPYGLAAYFYTRDLGRAWRVGEKLEYGMVGINTGLISNAVAPFGGVKESGLGREGSKYGVDDWLEIKYLCMGGIDK